MDTQEMIDELSPEDREAARKLVAAQYCSEADTVRLIWSSREETERRHEAV